jgi:hypothetical protein
MLASLDPQLRVADAGQEELQADGALHGVWQVQGGWRYPEKKRRTLGASGRIFSEDRGQNRGRIVLLAISKHQIKEGTKHDD